MPPPPLARLLPQAAVTKAPRCLLNELAVRFPFEGRRLVQVNRLASFLKRLTNTQQAKTQLNRYVFCSL